MISAKNLMSEMAKNALRHNDTPKRKRKRRWSVRGPITILICFPTSFVEIKHFIWDVCASLEASVFRRHSPHRSWRSSPMFCGYDHRFSARVFGECNGDKFCGQTCIPVIHNKPRFPSMKVLRILLPKGRVRMGWYVGFKLHR